MALDTVENETRNAYLDLDLIGKIIAVQIFDRDKKFRKGIQIFDSEKKYSDGQLIPDSMRKFVGRLYAYSYDERTRTYRLDISGQPVIVIKEDKHYFEIFTKDVGY